MEKAPLQVEERPPPDAGQLGDGAMAGLRGLELQGSRSLSTMLNEGETWKEAVKHLLHFCRGANRGQERANLLPLSPFDQRRGQEKEALAMQPPTDPVPPSLGVLFA